MTRLLCLSALVLASAAPAFAQSTSCKSMFDAMLKEMSVPHHAVATTNGGAAGESILAADGTNYVKISGAWRIYRTRYEQKDMGVTEGKLWIAKTTGLPLKTDLTTMADIKVSMSTVFDYTDIKAPAVK